MSVVASYLLGALEAAMPFVVAAVVIALFVGLHDFIERGLERRRARIAWERLKKGSAR